MVDLLQTAAQWLGRQRTASMAHEVTYSRGKTSATIRATAGRGALSEQIKSGIVLDWQDQDFLVLAADLAAFGEPQRGDVISDSSGGTALSFEVRPSAGEQVWRWSGVPGTTMRIHARRIDG